MSFGEFFITRLTSNLSTTPPGVIDLTAATFLPVSHPKVIPIPLASFLISAKYSSGCIISIICCLMALSFCLVDVVILSMCDRTRIFVRRLGLTKFIFALAVMSSGTVNCILTECSPAAKTTRTLSIIFFPSIATTDISTVISLLLVPANMEASSSGASAKNSYLPSSRTHDRAL